MFQYRLVLSSLLVAGCSASNPDRTPDDLAALPAAIRYVPRGPHTVGYAVLEAPRTELKAWYPTTTPEGPVEYTMQIKLAGFGTEPVTVLGTAALDAPVDAGPWPLIVLSHGFSMNPEWYHTLAEHLASYGFVVVGPEHVESDWFSDVIEATLTRPADVSDAIDFMSTDWVAGAVDVEHIAVVGHSYGGYTTLAVAGARFDLGGLAERCVGVEDPFVAAYFCGVFTAAGPQLAELMGLDAEPSGLWPSLADDRIDAIVPLAPDAYLFGTAGLAEVHVPTLVIGGTADTASPWDWGAGLAFDGVASEPRSLVSLVGAEHFTPVASCDDMPWTAGLPPEYLSAICSDPAWDKQDGLDVVHHFTTAFLLDTLTGDPDAAEALDPEHYADGDDALEYVRVP